MRLLLEFHARSLWWRGVSQDTRGLSGPRAEAGDRVGCCNAGPQMFMHPGDSPREHWPTPCRLQKVKRNNEEPTVGELYLAPNAEAVLAKGISAMFTITLTNADLFFFVVLF